MVTPPQLHDAQAQRGGVLQRRVKRTGLRRHMLIGTVPHLLVLAHGVSLGAVNTSALRQHLHCSCGLGLRGRLRLIWQALSLH